MTGLPLRLALFYAATFIVVGVRVPFWPPWLASRGLTAPEIGIVLAVTQWACVAAVPVAGILADRRGDARQIMLLLSFAGASGFLLCLPAGDFAALLLLSAATGALLAGVLPLGDNLTLAAASAGKLEYGRMRLWGSLSFIVTSVLAGELQQEHSGDVALYLLIAAAALTFFACLGLPAGAPALRQARPSAWRALIMPRFVVFLGAATLVQGSHVVFYAFSVLHWQGLGIDTRTVSLLWAEGVVAEVLLFFWGAPLLRRTGPLGLLALGGGAGLLRWTATAFTASVPLLALVQLLHGLTFGASHLGAMHHLARSVPAERGATGQAIYGAVVGGIGPGFLMLGAGALYQSAGGLAYLVMAGLAAAGGAIALWLARAES